MLTFQTLAQRKMAPCDGCSLITLLIGSICVRVGVCGWLCVSLAAGSGQGKGDVMLNQGLAASWRPDLVTLRSFDTVEQHVCMWVCVCADCTERTIDGCDLNVFWLSEGELHHLSLTNTHAHANIRTKTVYQCVFTVHRFLGNSVQLLHTVWSHYLHGSGAVCVWWQQKQKLM